MNVSNETALDIDNFLLCEKSVTVAYKQDREKMGDQWRKELY
jgi:hypothetical protein